MELYLEEMQAIIGLLRREEMHLSTHVDVDEVNPESPLGQLGIDGYTVPSYMRQKSEANLDEDTGVLVSSKAEFIQGIREKFEKEYEKIKKVKWIMGLQEEKVTSLQ